MSTDLDYEAFYQACIGDIERQQRQELDYFKSQSRRLYVTFCRAAELLEPGDTVVSIGAGSAYVEGRLADRLDIGVTVVDFPEAIADHRPHYDHYGFETIGCDLSESDPLPADRSFDLGMSCEIVEHIPEPPSNHLGKLNTALAEDALVLLTTPNIARIGNVVRLSIGESPLPDPERFFAPVGVENEGVHRREYTASEIETAMNRAGFDDVTVHYAWTSTLRRMYSVGGAGRVSLTPIEALIPRFKPLLLAVGR